MRKNQVKKDEVTDIIEKMGIVEMTPQDRALDFKDLMRFRINDILLVSSLYDFYTLVEDGQLSEAIFNEFFELNLHYVPHITRVNSGEMALRLLEERSFDLVITMLQLGDMDHISFCQKVKSLNPELPVILLAYQTRELQLLLERDDIKIFDRVFIWSGDRKLFLAIIKVFEDKQNAPSDCLDFGIRTIILVEDSPSFYSSYLPLIYAEVIQQVQNLLEEGKNFSDKLLRQRARPKILHATTFEEAWSYFEKYQRTLLGIITDMSFAYRGTVDPEAGTKFIEAIRNVQPELPIFLQTATFDTGSFRKIDRVQFADKNSRKLFQELSDFIKSNFGFGDFEFCNPDGEVLSKAKTLRELRDKLRHIPDQSLEFHASRDHFSNWLMARTRFSLANKLKPIKISEFADIDALRVYLLNEITQHLIQDQKGVIADFSRNEYDTDARFLRIGGGSLGGKGRGLAFIDSVVEKYLRQDLFRNVRISIPRTIVLGTDVFSQFMQINNLLSRAVENSPDEQILRMFIQSDLPPTILGDLRAILQKARFPLAIRSSSLLEDTLYQPFAGIYATLMIPNSNVDFSVRFHNLTQAIKYVYASTYFQSAKRYIEATANHVEEEKMAVIIQEMVGVQHEHFFYPHFSGVARSFNYYPFGKAKQRDGVVNLALGLGRMIVEGGVSLQYSPAYPTVFPQFSTTRDLFYNSQVKFFALNLDSDIIRKYPSEDQYLDLLGIDVADRHQTLTHIASTYSKENDALYEGVQRPGPRILNFAPILKSHVFPLNEILKLVLEICETAMNCPVEIEFAATLHATNALPGELRLLQVRPMVKEEGTLSIDNARIPPQEIVFQSEQTLGNGILYLREIVFIKPESFEPSKTRRIAEQLGKINAKLFKENRGYLLIGPGRWGSSDPSLGIPILFSDISGARAIAETTLPKMVTDPSQGSHFFQNLTSFRIVYFTLRHYNDNHIIDWPWLHAQRVTEETDLVCHVSLEEPVVIAVDGKTGNGIVLKRAVPDLFS